MVDWKVVTSLEAHAKLDANLPPRQVLAAPGKWPVVGESIPRRDGRPWEIEISGLVANPIKLSITELHELVAVEGSKPTIDIHCVTRWSKPAVTFGGVLLERLLLRAQPLPEARFVDFIARSERSHSTSLPLADALALGVLIATTCDGAPLSSEHGGPVRTITPGRYFYKSLKWLERIELLADDRLGYWEGQSGYHNRADPWKEERYIAGSIDRRAVQEMIKARSFAGKNLLSLAAADVDLDGLDARGAIMRNADFQRARLAGADFSGANLTNARFCGADLRGASFKNADVEGADFAGADLAGASFEGASLFGTTFD